MNLFLSKASKYLNTTLLIILGGILMVMLQGCPYSSQYCIDTNPVNQVNETYLGKWSGTLYDECGNQLPIQVDVSKIDDYYYEFLFHGKIFNHSQTIKRYFWQRRKKQINNPSEDTIACNAYMSFVNEREILNLNFDDQNYFVEVVFHENQLSLLMIAEEFSSKIMRSDNELKKSLEFHFKSHFYPVYDESLSLRNMTRVGP